MSKQRRPVVPFGMDALCGSADWEQSERRAAAAIGGRRHRGSGSSKYLRGDASNAQFLIENKSTAKDSIRVTWQWLQKITREALASDRWPMFTFEVRLGQPCDRVAETAWVAVPRSVWETIQERIEDNGH